MRASESMDSEPVKCIPVGSLVTVQKSRVSFEYGLMARRVFISYVSPVDGNVFEGWASVQSAQGYTILSPLIDMCNNNSRWGSTRPIFRLCGHAAHLGCVDRHVASIHQKAEQETPFDGRFAAEIIDGEFLCPLCKQLSNIVVPVQENEKPEEKPLESCSMESKMEDRLLCLSSLLKESIEISRVNESMKIAMKQYGNYLYQAMEVTSWHKSKQLKNPWHRTLKSWDFKEDSPDVEGTPTKTIGDILPLLRQLHISWSATGHLAASAEASARGIRKAGFEPPTSDPWTDFNEECKDTHPTLLELRRTMIATASLFEVVSLSIHDQLATTNKEDPNLIQVVGTFLSNILCGDFWTKEVNSDSSEWKVLNALLASIPCHVARDESLSVRHEARATAAQIWSLRNVKSVDTETASEGGGKESTLSSPYVPKCIRNIPDYKDILKDDWGTMDLHEGIVSKKKVFKPLFASGFLYMPLLSWDLNTFAGAIFSSLLSTNNLLQQSFGDAAKILLVARVVQVIMTPNVFKNPEESHSLEADLDIEKENEAIKFLVQHCNSFLHPSTKVMEKDSCDHFVTSISHAILPFARTLLLLLRGAFSAARQKGYVFNGSLEDFVLDEDAMYIEDGFYFMQKLDCPLPSYLSDSISDINNPDSNFWANLINNWINAIVSFDAYHGSLGSHLDYNKEKQSWQHIEPTRNSNKKLKSEKQAKEQAENHESTETSNMQVDNEEINEATTEINGDVHMGDEMSVDNQVTHFQFDAMDSPLNGSVGFEDINGIDDNSADFPDVFGLPSLPSQPSQDTSILNQNDEESICTSSDLEDDIPDDDELCANISSATIIPFQPSMLGNKKPGPGPRGSLLDYSLASTVMCDLSHLGSVHCDGKSFFSENDHKLFLCCSLP